MISMVDLDDRQRAIAAERAAILGKYQSLRKGGLSAKEALKKIGISAPTLSRWNKAFEIFGVAGLADQTNKRRGGQNTLPDDQKNFLYQTTLTQHRPKLLTVYRTEYMLFCASIGQAPVSYATFLRAFNDIPESVKLLYRNGSKSFENSQPYHLRDWNLVKSMEVIFCDHVQLNFFARLNGDMVRPWVTWWMDGHSRKQVSFIVTTKPNQDTILLSLLHAVKRYGTPSYAYMDNGKDFKSIALNGTNVKGKRASKLEILMDETMIRGVFQSLHIEPIFAIPYNAQAKPIEPAHNYIHNLSRLLDYGYAGANVLDRPEYMDSGIKVRGQKKKFDLSKILDWNDVHGVVEGIFQEYDSHVNEGLNKQLNAEGMTAEAVFEQGFDREVFKVWKSMVNEKDLTMLMMRVVGRTYKVHSNGVNYLKHYYFHDLLLVKEMEGQQVIVRFDPADVDKDGVIQKIYIYDAKDRFVCGAPLLGMTHPVAATKEDYAEVNHRKRLRKEQAQNNYKEATRLIPEINLESMSFSTNNEGAN